MSLPPDTWKLWPRERVVTGPVIVTWQVIIEHPMTPMRRSDGMLIIPLFGQSGFIREIDFVNHF